MAKELVKYTVEVNADGLPIGESVEKLLVELKLTDRGSEVLTRILEGRVSEDGEARRYWLSSISLIELTEPAYDYIRMYCRGRVLINTNSQANRSPNRSTQGTAPQYSGFTFDKEVPQRCFIMNGDILTRLPKANEFGVRRGKHHCGWVVFPECHLSAKNRDGSADLIDTRTGTDASYLPALRIITQAEKENNGEVRAFFQGQPLGILNDNTQSGFGAAFPDLVYSAARGAGMPKEELDYRMISLIEQAQRNEIRTRTVWASQRPAGNQPVAASSISSAIRQPREAVAAGAANFESDY